MSRLWLQHTIAGPPRVAGSKMEGTSAAARIGRSISSTSVAIEFDQPLVADPEVMGNLVEHDVSDLAA